MVSDNATQGQETNRDSDSGRLRGLGRYAFDFVGMGLNSLCLVERLRRGHITDGEARDELIGAAERCGQPAEIPAPRATTEADQ